MKRWAVFLAVAAAGVLLLRVFGLPGSRAGALRELEARGVAPRPSAATAAASAGDAKVLALLARAGVAPDAADESGLTPLIAAVRAREDETARYLLKHVEDLDAEDAGQRSALSHAVIREDWPLAHELVARGATVDIRLGPGSPAIVDGAAAQHRALVDFLIEHGADMNFRDDGGASALAYAVALRDQNLVEALLRAGADATTGAGRGRPLMSQAARAGEVGILKLLADFGADPEEGGEGGITALALAVSRNRLETVEFLLDRGVVPSERDEFFYPLLLAAVDHGNSKLFEILCAAGASLSAGDAAGRTALGEVLKRGDEEMFNILLEAGAAVESSLPEIFESGTPGMMEAVLAREPDLEVDLGDGETILARTVRRGRSEAALRLLAAGARPGLYRREGQPLMAWAVARGDRELTRGLLEAGADPNAALASPASGEFRALVPEEKLDYYLRQDTGLTPLMLAAGRGEKEIVRELLEHGAKTSVHTRKHKSYPIHFACQSGDTDIMQLVLGKDPENQRRKIVVDLSQQRAWLYRDDKLLYSTSTSTGKKGYSTKPGEYVITDKHRNWTSTIYHVKMPFFMRLNCDNFGLHEGFIPNYPASHGCIRLPSATARKFFEAMEVGDVVSINK